MRFNFFPEWWMVCVFVSPLNLFHPDSKQTWFSVFGLQMKTLHNDCTFKFLWRNYLVEDSGFPYFQTCIYFMCYESFDGSKFYCLTCATQLSSFFPGSVHHYYNSTNWRAVQWWVDMTTPKNSTSAPFVWLLFLLVDWNVAVRFISMQGYGNCSQLVVDCGAH